VSAGRLRRTLGLTVIVSLAFLSGWIAAGIHEGGDANAPAVPFGEHADPSEAFVAALRLEDPAERARVLSALLERTSPDRARDLRDLLVNPEPGMIVDEIAESLVASWWARADPAAAFENAVDPAWSGRHPWLRNVLREWVKRQPLMAVEAVGTLPPEQERSRLEAARVVLDGWLALDDLPDPTPLVRLFRHLELKPRALAMERMLDALVERWGIDGTVRFVESLQPMAGTIGPQVEQELRARLGVALLDHDVERAIAWADEQGRGREGVGVRKHLAYYWGLRDGRAAMEWALALPETPERGAVVKRAWISFGRVKPDEARAWLLERGPEPALAGIYARHLRHVAAEDPQRALSLARRASDEPIYPQMLFAVGLGWMKSQPQEAEVWLESGEVPADVVARIRRAVDRGAESGGGPVRNSASLGSTTAAREAGTRDP